MPASERCVRRPASSMSNTRFTIEYLCAPGRTPENPSDIWDAIQKHDPRLLAEQLRKLSYQSFLQTPYWQAVTAAKKKRTQWRCERCHEHRSLNIHHRTYRHHCYEHLWLNEDLECLCEPCHSNEHGFWSQRPPPLPPRDLMRPRVGGRRLPTH